MTNSIWQATAQNSAGDIVPGAEILVIDENTGLDAVIYSTREGAALANPFNADAEGFIQFYAPANETTYRINANDTGTGLSITWRFVQLGIDIGTDAGQIPRNSDLGTSSAIDTGTAFDQIPLNADIVYPVNTIAELKALTGVGAGQKVSWLGYYAASDGGSNWGEVSAGAHTEDNFEIFSIDANTYVKANISGSTNAKMAGLFGGITNASDIENLISKSKSKIKMAKDATYVISSGVDIVGNGKTLDLNGCTLEFTTTTYSLYDKGNNNSVINGTITTDYTPGTGGNGHSGSCITIGEQSTGSGNYGFSYKKLELTTNRSDAGAHISVIGECWNGSISKIKIRDNAVCRNIIGMEWGGTVAGTGHPHDIAVNNIRIGKITTPTYGSSGYAFAVWCSAGFNISVSNVFMEEGFGLMMLTAGDRANEYAPTAYKSLVGTGVSIKRSGISACFGYGLRCIGKASGSSAQISAPLKASGITIVGKKIGANNNFALQTEFSDGVHLSDFSVSGVFAGGITTGSDVKNLLIENGSVTGCELYGVSIGSGAIKSIKPTIRRLELYKNNTLAGIGSGTSAIVVSGSENACVEFCGFGIEGEPETQRYSVYTAAAANKPKVLHNHTYVNDNPATNPYLDGSTTTFNQNNTKDF